MDQIEILGKRVDELESQIIGKKDVNQYPKSVTDALLQAQTMISSALSCRDSITTIIQNMTTLNEYLDPQYAENMQDIQFHRQYIEEMYTELTYTYGSLLSSFQDLLKYLDSDNIKNMVANAEKIEKAAGENLEILDCCRITTESTLKILQGYNEMMSTIKKSFRELDNAVFNIERKMQAITKVEE